MAHITWMNVPIPDIGSTQQQGIRTAADLLGNAAKSAQAGVAGLQAIQDAEKAAQTQAADRFVLENMLSTQDPNKYNQMRADGSLFGPATGKVSNSMLVAAEARSGQLYTQDRERTRNTELQAAERIWDQASSIAVNDPAKAQEILAAAKFTNAEDAAAFSHRARQLFVDPENGRAARERSKKEEIDRKGVDYGNRYIQMGNNPEGRAALLQAAAKDDPLVLNSALSFLRANGEDTRTSYSTTPTANESIGSNSVITDGPENSMFKQFGPNEKFVRAAAASGNYFPGTSEWNIRNPGKVATMGDVYDYQDKYIKPFSKEERAKEGKQPTTAVGPAQIVNNTREDFVKRHGQRLFGTTDMSKIPYTPENEDKLSSAIYDEQLVRNKSPEAWQATQKYPSLKDLKAFEGKSWDEAKPLLHYIDGGVTPSSYQKRAKQFEAELNTREKGLSEGARVILNAEPNNSWGLNEAATELTKALGKESRPGEAREVVEATVRKAKEAGSTITYAEAVGLIKNSISDDRKWTWSNLSDDLDLEDSKLAQSAVNLGNARTDLESFKKNKRTLEKILELSEQYKKDKAAAESQLAKAKEPNSNAGVATINVFRKWQNTSDQLANLVAPKGKTEVASNFAPEANPATAQAAPQEARPPDINLMLPPAKPTLPASRPVPATPRAVDFR